MTNTADTITTTLNGTVTLHCEQHGTILAYVWRNERGARVSQYHRSETVARTFPPK